MPDDERCTPIYVGTIAGKSVRFYHPQNGDDMMPWVATDDLCLALGMNREARRAMKRCKFTEVAKRVRVEDGSETQLLAFQGVQGLMGGLIETRHADQSVHMAYVQEVVAAAECIFPGLFKRDASGEILLSSVVVARLLGEDHAALCDRIESEGLAVQTVHPDDDPPPAAA